MASRRGDNGASSVEYLECRGLQCHNNNMPCVIHAEVIYHANVVIALFVCVSVVLKKREFAEKNAYVIIIHTRAHAQSLLSCTLTGANIRGVRERTRLKPHRQYANVRYLRARDLRDVGFSAFNGYYDIIRRRVLCTIN